MSGAFGWSYPPGCSGPPDDYPEICSVCGKTIDDCICPECHECGEIGQPLCYEKHGLIKTLSQIESFDAAIKAEEEFSRLEHESIASMQTGLNEEAWNDCKYYSYTKEEQP